MGFELKPAALAAIILAVTGVNGQVPAAENGSRFVPGLPIITRPAIAIVTTSTRGPSYPSLQTAGPYPFGNSTSHIGTGVATGNVGTGVTSQPSATIPGYDPIYTGPVPAWAEEIIKEAKALDAIASKLWEEAKSLFGDGTQTTSSDPSIGTVGVQTLSPRFHLPHFGGHHGGEKLPSEPKALPKSPDKEPDKQPEEPNKEPEQPAPTPPPSANKHITSHAAPVAHSSHTEGKEKTSSEKDKTSATTKEKEGTSSRTSTSKGKQTTSTRTSTSKAPSATNDRPKCGGGTCSGSSCSVTKPAKKLEKNALAVRSPLGSSLQVKSLLRRAYVQDVVPKGFASRVANGKTATGTLLINSVFREPQLEGDAGTESSTSQVLKFAEIGQDFNAVTGMLTGCTAVMVVSDKALFTSHYWEFLAYSPNPGDDPVDFTEQVITPLIFGRRFDNQVVQDSLLAAKNLNLFDDATVYIMTPAKDNIDRDIPLYSAQLELLKSELRNILGLATPINEHLYVPADSGWYPANEFPHIHSSKSRIKPKEEGEEDEEDEPEDYYPELAHKQTNSDGYSLFQYAVDQSNGQAGMRIFIENTQVLSKTFKLKA